MTRIDPKISTIDPQSSQNNKALRDGADTSDSTKFVKVNEKDPWKALTSTSGSDEAVDVQTERIQDFCNNATAPADYSGVVNAFGGGEINRTYKGPIDAILDSLVINDPIQKRRYAVDHALPSIPDLHKDLLKDNPGIQMKPVVERYEALKLTLEELRQNALESLKNPMNTSEIQSNQDYIRHINDSLMEVEKQLEEANYYLYLERMREKAAEDAEDA